MLKSRQYIAVVFACLLFFASATQALAATIQWAGGVHNWSDTAGWVGGVVPGADSDVRFSTNTTGTLTVDGTSASPSKCRSIVFTSFTGTMTMGATAYLQIGDGTAGATTFVSGQTFTPNAAATIEFVSTTTGNNITFGGKTFPLTIFNGVGGGWQFQDNALFQSNVSNAVTLTKGSLDTNGKTITSGDFQSSNSNTRSLTLGATTWTLANSSGAVWNIGTATGMTLSAASSTITTTNSLIGYTFSGGGLTYGTVQVTGSNNTPTTINQANTFGALSFAAGGASSNVILAANQTITGTFTPAGGATTARLFIKSSVRGTQRTITAATVTASNADFQDIVGAGAASWNLAAISGLSGNCGNNSSITFTTPVTQYWVPTGGTSSGSFSATTRWATASNGTPGTGRVPLCQDSLVFDGSSIDAGSRTITQDMVRIGSVNWTGVTNTPAWTKSTATSFYGSITMVSGMTNSGTQAYTYEGRSSSTFNTGTLTWTNPLVIDAVDGSGTLTLGASATSSSTFTMTSGTFAGASTYTLTVTSFSFGGGTFTPSGTTTLSAGMTVSGGTLTQSQAFSGVTTFTMSGGTFAMDRNLTISSTMTLQSGTISGAYTISGGTTITFSGSATTLNAPNTTFSGTTITLNGSGSTWYTNTVTGTGALTATTGTLYHSGTVTANSAALIIPYRPTASRIRSGF